MNAQSVSDEPGKVIIITAHWEAGNTLFPLGTRKPRNACVINAHARAKLNDLEQKIGLAVQRASRPGVMVFDLCETSTDRLSLVGGAIWYGARLAVHVNLPIALYAKSRRCAVAWRRTQDGDVIRRIRAQFTGTKNLCDMEDALRTIALKY